MAHHRHQQTFINGHRHTNVNMLVEAYSIAQPAAVDHWMLFQGQSRCFDHHVIETHTHFTRVIDRFSGLHCGIHVDAHCQIEMRRREFTFRQAARNGLAHLTNSNFGESLYTGCDSAHSSSLKRLDIAFHNAPTFTRTGDVS